MTDAEIEAVTEIARGLTKAQKELLCRLPLPGKRPFYWTSDDVERELARSMPALVYVGLASTIGPGFAALLTVNRSLGKQVQAYLLTQQESGR